MKIIITGGAGFIGSHLTNRLIKDGHRVVVIDNLAAGQKKNLDPQATFYCLNVNSPKINNLFKREKPEVVFHLAAQINLRRSIENPIYDAKNNILGSLNILEAARKNGVKKIIFPSTAGIYNQNPKIPTLENYPILAISPYTLAKLTIEKYLEVYRLNFGLNYTILRFSNVYGPRQNPHVEAGVISIFIEKLLKSQPPTIYGQGEQTRDYLYVDDAVEAFVLAMKNKKSGLYNAGTAREISVKRLFDKISSTTKIKIKPLYQKSIKGEVMRSALDYKKIKKDLNWHPKISLEKGLEKTINWFKIKNDNKSKK